MTDLQSRRLIGKVISFPTKQRDIARRPGTSGSVDFVAIENRIRSIPIIKQALFFLERSGGEKGIKLTEKGSLGRNFVQEFWEKHVCGPEDLQFRPTREFECPEVTRIHSLLTESKYVRKFRGAICLTPKGRRALERGPSIDLYKDLLNAGVFAWNWGYEDRYPEFEFIQGSANELISLLWRWPNEVVNAAEFFDTVFEAFDEDGASADSNGNVDDECSIWDSRKWVVRCFHVRFFVRFCVPFGILRDLSESRLIGEPSDPFGKTEFFASDFSKIVQD